MKKPRIIVYVEGGSVQIIKSDTDNVDIEVLDVDRAEGEFDPNKLEGYYRLQLEFGGLPFKVWGKDRKTPGFPGASSINP